LVGCVVLQPKYALLKTGPAEIMGMKCTDLGNLLFKIGSVLYFTAAICALGGICAGIAAARREKRGTAKLWASAPAFLLFMCTSTLFFYNGCMPKDKAIEAGNVRMGGAACLFAAVVLLFLVAVWDLLTVERSPRDPEMTTSLQTA